VMAYTNADSVELFLNGKSLGRKRMGEEPVVIPVGKKISEDLSFLTVRIEDAGGHLVPGADNLVRFALSGAGRIAGVDNGNPASLEPFQAGQRTAFGGLALVIVRSKRGEAGRIAVEAASDGLAAGRATISTRHEP